MNFSVIHCNMLSIGSYSVINDSSFFSSSLVTFESVMRCFPS